MTRRWWLPAVLSLALAGCGQSGKPAEAKKAAPPAKVDNRGIQESDLATIRLTPEAEKRLGIETGKAESRRVRESREYPGEAVVPAGRSITVSAPVAGTLTLVNAAVGRSVRRGEPLFRLQPFAGVQRDLLATAEADVAAAKARLEGAQQREQRATQLVRDEVGSVRQREAAQEELKVAEAALQAAVSRLQQVKRSPLDADTTISIAAPADGMLRQVFAAAGQMTPAGAALAEVVDLGTLYIRVPVYAGELAQLDPAAGAEVRAIGAAGGPALFVAEPVAAPPTADPLSSTVDLYYRSEGLRLGQRVSVAVPMRREEQAIVVPWAAVLHDFNGGAWVYERRGPLTYVRRRIEVRRVSGGSALLAGGIAAGAEIVSAGAAELFGVEFGAGK